MNELYREFNYPSANQFYKIVRDNGIKATLKEIKDFISQQAVQQLHKPVRQIKSKMKHITASAPNEIFQIDLLDYQKYSRFNKGFNWILICVDIFTRQAQALPILTKHSANAAEAFEKMILDVKPHVVFSDDGNEWRGKFQEVLEKNNIIHQVKDYGDHNSLGIIDRFSQTVKRMIAKFMTANDTKRWIDQLPKIIKIYNNTPHSGISDIKPKDAEQEENQETIGTINFDKRDSNIKKSSHTLKPNDHVRIQRMKGTFEKGYEITYSKEIHKVISVENSHATLDDGSRHKIDKLLFIDPRTESLQSRVGDAMENQQKTLRRLMKEGISTDNIIGGGRRGKTQSVAFPSANIPVQMYRRDAKF